MSFVAGWIRAIGCSGAVVPALLAAAEPPVVDTSFDPGGGPNGAIRKLLQLADGTLLVGGNFTQFDGTGRLALARLSNNGSLDANFIPNLYRVFSALGAQADSRILRSTVSGTDGVDLINPDGRPDPAFLIRLSSLNRVLAMAVQVDGKIVLVGEFSRVNGVVMTNLARVDAQGILDPEFQAQATYDSTRSATVNDIAVESDGKLIIAGRFTLVNGVVRTNIARLHPDGSVDLDYDPGRALDFVRLDDRPAGQARFIRLQSDGSAFLAFSRDAAPPDSVARINVDGTLSAGFTIARVEGGAIADLAIQSDGRAIVAGSFTGINGGARPRIARLDPDGTVDPLFAPVFTTNSDAWSVSALLIQADAKLVIGGDGFTAIDGFRAPNLARLRLLPPPLNAVPQITQAPASQSVIEGAAVEFMVEANGSLPLGYQWQFNGQAIASARASTFRIEEVSSANSGRYTVTVSNAFSMAISPPATLTVLPRRTLPGSVAPDFKSPYSSGAQVLKVTFQGEKLVTIAYLSGPQKNNRFQVDRLRLDGSIDPTFTSAMLEGGIISSLALYIDGGGRVLVAGDFSHLNGAPRPRVARLNADGTFDTSFDVGTGPDFWVLDIASQADNKVLIVGEFAKVNDVPRQFLARLTVGGAVDIAFDPARAGATDSLNLLRGPPRHVMELEDGTILVDGYNVNNNGVPYFLGKFKRDGQFAGWATALERGRVNYRVGGFRQLAEGKLLAVASYASDEGVIRNGLLRFHRDGTLDLSFNAVLQSVEEVGVFVVQPDGKIIVAGPFTEVLGTPRGRLARLHSDGALDRTFDVGTGFNGPVHSMVLAPDGSLYLGGAFSAVNGVTRFGLAKLHGDSSWGIPLPARQIPPEFTVWTTAGTFVSLQARESLGSGAWQSVTTVTGDGTMKSLVDTNEIRGQRYYRLMFE